MVALDSKTGKLIWKCTGAGDKPGYASPILIDYQGLKQVVTAMSESIIGVRASDGRLLWRFPHKVYADENITTPLFKEGLLIISGCGKKGTRALKLDVSGKECEARQKWHNPALDNKQGGLVLFNERIYGYAESQRKAGPWMCIDFKSGRTLFQESPVRSTYIFKCGSITCADGLLYLFSDNGNMALVKPLETGFETKGHLTVKEKGSRPTWAFPVVYGGRLYIRCGDNLFAYNVLK
jgi:outer membrane protein assembly factor BamB